MVLLVPSAASTPEPVVYVLVFSSLAAAASALGALPLPVAHHARPRVAAGAEALASGLMLGAGYLLMAAALDRSTVWALLGAALGVGYTSLAQWYAGTQEFDAGTAHASPELGYKLLLQRTLHSASEGIAIGIAMVLDLRLGIFVALALGIHNIAEGVSLADVLRRRGASLHQTAALCVVSKLSQPLLALATFALYPLLEPILGGALGFSAGSLAFLVLTELVPDAYLKERPSIVAMLVTVAAALVVLLEDFLT